MNNSKNFTIGEILGLLEDSTFYYEILTDIKISEEPTEDCLHRHVLEDFPGYKANSFTVHRKPNKQYLSMTLKFDDDLSFDDDKLNKLATVENMKLCFIDEMISSEGKLIIPYCFEDSIYPEKYANSSSIAIGFLDVEFIFSHVDNILLLDYITVI